MAKTCGMCIKKISRPSPLDDEFPFVGFSFFSRSLSDFGRRSLLDLAARTSNNLVRRLHDMAMPIPALPSTVSPLSPPTDAEVQDLKARIAQVWAVREGLKHALNQCVASPNRGLRELEAVDRQLAELDSRFKRMWDLQQNANKAQPKELA